MTVTVDEPVVRISGDISGDETGEIYFDEGCTVEVPCTNDAVRIGAREVAERLAAQRVVLDAIRHRNRGISEE